eukprot:Hpha_TRINITY_DN15877_c3_g2::TRINITY_DN15877_c3_g2_i8::g.189835::m.189835
MGGCCRWRWLVRPGDTPDEARIKTSVFPVTLFIMLFNVFVVANTLQTTNQMVSVIGYSINAIAFLQFMVGVVSNAVPAGYLLDVALLIFTVGTCAMDLGNATRSSPFRSWACVVL